MPTPVTTAKQCLNPEASHALDEAVLVARRRSHPQTTSLHAVSSFLSVSPSLLREACIRARNSAFYPKVQLKALDFCLTASLDRLPISQTRIDEPHISNSLMAAIKRSQANQRRHPDNIMAVKSMHAFHVGHAQDQNLGNISSSCSVVKVDLQHLIVAILDDPIVSRVFNDAGFSSFDVKLAILRPFQSVVRYLDQGLSRARFPFPGCWDEEGEWRRVVEVLRRKRGRNPLLVGVCACDVLKGFLEGLEKKREGVLSIELCGVRVISIENDVVKFVSENWSDEAMNVRFKEVGVMVEHSLGNGVMVNVGDVRCFLGKDKGCEMNVVNFVVRKVTKLLEIHGGKVWLIGSAANDQMYKEFINRFPLIDKEWDLQPLPITSIKPSSSLTESCFKSSLMGSFVPFGGFFSSPPNFKGQSSSVSQSSTCCQVSAGKSQQDIKSSSQRRLVAKAADQHQTALSSWLQMADLGANVTLDVSKAKHGPMLLSGTVAGLQRNQDNMSQCPDYNLPSSKPDSFLSQTRTGSRCTEQQMKSIYNGSTCTTTSSCKNCDYTKINSCMSTDLHKLSTTQSSKLVLLGSSKDKKNPSELSGSPSKFEHSRPHGSSSPHSLRVSGADDGETSPSSGVTIATDLGLELVSQIHSYRKKADQDLANGCQLTKCSNPASLNFGAQPGDDYKALFKALFGRLGRQCEALRVVSQIVIQSKRSGLRADIWLNFIGPDIFGQRRTALALADILYGSKKYFVHVDLKSEDVVLHQKKLFGYQITNGSDTSSRGKTVIDHIAEQLRKMPFGVVLLENAHSADPVAQRSLLQAISIGKFSDSYGREVSLSNRIFVLSSRLEDNYSSSRGKPSNFSEERLLKAKGWPLQLLVKEGHIADTNSVILGAGNTISNQAFSSKRKLNGTHESAESCVVNDKVKRPHKGPSLSLDLNLPAQIGEGDDTIYEETDERSEFKISKSWLEEFSDQATEKTLMKVVFKPFDYDALAAKVLKSVHASFRKVTSLNCLLEIKQEAMDEIIAAACSLECDKEIEDWIEQVLSKGFAEAHKIYQLTAHSIVTLTTCDALPALQIKEQGSGVCLPSKVSMA